MPITYGSVCSGIEAATVAWEPLGWKASWYAEIEPFPSAVLAHHYPDTLNNGDMTRLAAMVLAGKIPVPEVLVSGTPCIQRGRHARRPERPPRRPPHQVRGAFRCN